MKTAAEKTPQFRSSKGFEALQNDDKGESCPYSKCGRRFANEKMLKQHIERRHGGESAQPEEKKETMTRFTKLGTANKLDNMIKS